MTLLAALVGTAPAEATEAIPGRRALAAMGGLFSETAICPVVVLTSSRELNDQAESCKLGANSYIVKPVEFEQFNKSVAEIGTYWLMLNHQPPRL